jgi:hypothetical protein
MARRKRKKSLRSLLVIALLVASAVALWTQRETLTHWFGKAAGDKVAATNGSSSAETPTEGRPLHVSGELAASGPAHDVQLGVSANAAVLFRHVEMYQWQEHCQGGACRYDGAWSAPLDSHKFRDPKGHENPPAPFNDSTFFAPGIKLDGYLVDPDLLVAQLHATDYAAHNANLPPNLAASFGERDGVLYAGGDPAHPVVGAVRISYRVIGKGTVALSGVQHGTKLSVH